MKYILILLIFTSNVIAQNNLVIKINKAIKEDDLHLIYKNFKDKYIFNLFEKQFAGQTNLKLTIINDKQRNSRHVVTTKLIGTSGNRQNDSIEIKFYTETIQDYDYIYIVTFDDKKDKTTDSILSTNFLLNKIDLPYNENQDQKYRALDSLGLTLEELFKNDKSAFLNKYFLPDNCDNSVGDSWASMNIDAQKELNKVELVSSSFDKKINAGTITLMLYFDNNNYQEKDILYFKYNKKSFHYYYTSQNFRLIKLLE
jgi:hypothetical protein